MIRGLRDISGIDHERFMIIALEEAAIAGRRGDRPIGCVIVHDNRIVAKGSSTYRTKNSQVHHAENSAVLSCASFLKDNGPECVLYATLEPCIMCLSTILMGNIRNIVIALDDKYMNTRENVKGFAWMEDRIFNYIRGIKRLESADLIKRYCSRTDQMLIFEGKRE